MLRPTQLRRRIAERRGRNESGYTLIIVLAGTVIFGLVVAALLTLVATQARSQAAYFKSDAHKRATDGGLELGLGKLKSVTAAEVAAGSDACAGFTSVLPAETIEGKQVEVDCVPGDTSKVTRYIPTKGDGTRALRTNNWGEQPMFMPTFLREIADALGWTWQVPGFAVVSNSVPRIYGQVQVSNNGEAITAGSQSAALWVDGKFMVGGYSNACVVPDGNPWSFENMFSRRRNVASTAGPVACTEHPPAMVSPASAIVGRPTPAATFGSCAPGGLVTFEPGYYSPAAVVSLNTMFNGSCPNTTFWFKPGVHYFDATATYSTVTAAGYLRFADSTSRFVFGEPKGWNPATGGAAAANFPNACDHEKNGVSVVFGPNSSMQLTGGQVAICGPVEDSTRRPAISTDLSTTPSTTIERWGLGWWTVGGWGSTNSNGNPGLGGMMLSTPDAQPSSFPTLGRQWNHEATRTTNEGWCAYGVHWCEYIWSLTGPEGPSATAGGQNLPLAGAQMHLKLKTYAVAPSKVIQNGATEATLESKIIVEIYKPGSSTPCQAIENLAPYITTATNNTNFDKVMTINLLSTNTSDPCASVLRNVQDLSQARVDIRVVQVTDMEAMVDVGPYPWTSKLYLDHVSVEAAIEVPSTMAPSPRVTATVGSFPNEGSSSLNVFGLVNMPNTQIEVMWRQDVNTAPSYELPVFVGEVNARSFWSWNSDTNRRVGPLLARSITPATRIVTIRSIVDGRVAGTVDVEVSDLKSPPNPDDPIGVATSFRTTNWTYCNKELTADATCKG